LLNLKIWDQFQLGRRPERARLGENEMPRLTAVFAGLIGSLLLVAGPGASQAPAHHDKAPAAPPAAKAEAHALTQQDVDAWLDGFVPYALKSGDIAGGVVVVVKDGQVLTERGFGYSDVKAQKPVDPKTTLFRPGSVSKLFTWTAVMQQVEAGKLNLDADVNQYIDFKIPPLDGKPITLRNLLTHTAGFEETAKNLFVDHDKEFMKLGAWLKEWVPNRIYPAGEQVAYSNYGAALAGYIVERVSGEPFDDYVAHHIFQPLGMTHSTFDQPLPASLSPDMAKGYPQASKDPKPFELVVGAPAGSLTASGDDMAKFMIAHLADGRYGSVQILKPETAQLMHKEAFVLTPPLPGYALGFYHEDRNGQTIIAHAGDTGVFHSDLHLILNQHVGLFVSFNSAGKGGAVGPLREALFRAFVDRYWPVARPELPTWKDAKKDGAFIAGSYIANRRADSNFLRLLSAVGPAKVTVDKDGIVSVSAFKTAGGAVKKWREIGPYLWQEQGGESRMAARFVNGKYLGFISDDLPPVLLFQKAPIWANPLPLAISLGLLALYVVMWPLSMLVRRKYGQSFGLTGTPASAYRLVRFAALADVLVVVAWVAFLQSLNNDIGGLTNKVDMPIMILELLGILVVLGGLVGLWNLSVVWRDGARSWLGKLSSLVLAAALLGMAWVVVSLHMIGWNTNF
jgi:CubicO group peptidase (beta-lactamase class C family)